MVDTKSDLKWAEISLSALQHNLEMVRKDLNNSTRIMAVVKANAYGHGSVEISRALINFGIDAIAVATVSEAVELRQNQIYTPSLILGSVAKTEVDELFIQDLMPTLHNTEMAFYLNECGRKRGQIIKAHLRVDSGMGSYGFLPAECLLFIDELRKLDYLKLDGVYTHINSIYGGSREDAITQLNTFEHLLETMNQRGLDIPHKHASSSPAVFKLPEAEYDMVRLGIVLYGLPCGNDFLDDKIRAVMQVKTRIVAIKEVGKDFGVGYGWTFTTSSIARIATLPLGYADAGFLHFLNGGEVLIRGIRAPIIGKSCMDHMIIDVSHIEGVAIGDEATVLGEQGNQKISAEEIALRSGININNCDIVCLLSSRVPRVYSR